MRRLAVALFACLVAGAAEARTTCPAGLHPAMTAELFFGAEIPGGGSVSASDWESFLRTEVTPRFPDGLTTWEAQGRWRTPAGVQTQEASRILLLVLSGRGGERAKLAALIESYKTRFHQMSVGLVEHVDCARF